MKADFYNGLEWIGSIKEGGEIWNVPLLILIQVNPITFEEDVFDYIRKCDGIIANHPCQWPWDWPDSRMTDYTYIFHPSYGKVFVSLEGSDLLDPIKIYQGFSIDEAEAGIVALFPTIKEVMNGQTSSTVV
jgi:hypothetical protein